MLGWRRIRRATLVNALLAMLLAVGACSDDDHSQAMTPSAPGDAEATATPTTTPTVTPDETARLRVILSNPTTMTVAGTVSGTLVGAATGSGATTYETAMEVTAGGSGLVEATGLHPGIWLHTIAIPATGQQQYRQSLVIADPSGADVLAWTAYASVLVVTDGGDDGDGTCDATCTLRDAVTAANAAAAPALVVFDHAALGAPAEVALIEERLEVTGAGLTIDGTDASGNPSPVAPFADRSYPTLITMTATETPVNPPPSASCPCEDEYGGEMYVTAAAARFIGLQIERRQPAQADVCCGDQDLIELGSGAAGTRIEACLLDGGGRTITDSVTPMGMTGQATGKDCVEPKNTGGTAGNPVTVNNNEIRFCMDRGVKVDNNLALVTDNWIHNNLRCGLFALVSSGVIQAERNLIEENGMNCPTGAPPNCTDQVVTRPDAPQVAAQGAGSMLLLQDNVVRDGPLTGLYMENGSLGTLQGELACGMGDDGILSEKSTGSEADVVVRGSAAALNDGAGVKLEGSIGIDLGSDGDANAGDNAFVGNPHRKQVVNEIDGASAVAARGNQWQSCYATASPTPDACDTSAISDDDTNNTSGEMNLLDVSNPQPQQSTAEVTLTSAQPTEAVLDGPVTLHGSGFDAVTGYLDAADGDCTALGTSNTCTPLQGTCVEFLAGDTWVAAADVLAVTPTSITARAPFTCSTPSAIRVRRAVLGGGEVVSNPLPFCTEAQ